MKKTKLTSVVIALAAVILTAVVSPPLQAEFTTANIGDNNANGTADISNPDEILVTGGGSDIWGTADNFTFVYEPISGDFDKKVQIKSITQPSNRNGLMFRSSLDPGSQTAYNTTYGGQLPGNTLHGFHIRTVDNGGFYWANPPFNNWLSSTKYLPPNNYLRLKRQGNQFSAFLSADGLTWMSFGKGSIDIPTDGLIGFATANGGGQALYSGYGNFTYPNPTVEIRVGPVAIDTVENLPATFTVVALGFSGNTQINSDDVSYQWFVNNVAVPEANSATFKIAQLSLADDQSKIKVVVSIPGSSTTSSTVNLGVKLDNFGPTVDRTGGFIDSISIAFDGLMNQNTTDKAENYTLVGGGQVVAAALADDKKTVHLTVTGVAVGPYSIKISGVKDVAGNTIAANTQASGITLPMRAGNGTISSGPNSFSIADDFAYYAIKGDFDKKVQITSVSAGEVGLRASVGAEPNDIQVRIAVTDHINLRGIADDVSGLGQFGRGYGGVADNLPNQWIRLRRVGDNFQAFVGINGQQWSLISERYMNNLADDLLVGLYGGTATFENFLDTDLSDTTAPTLISAGTLDKKTIGVKFSEAPSAASLQTANFIVSGGTVTAVKSGLNVNTVHLTVTGLTADTFTVKVNGVKDAAGNTIAANSSVQAKASDWKAVDIGAFDPENRSQDGDDPFVVGQSVGVSSGDNIEVEVIGGGSNLWNAGDFGHFLYKEVTGDFDVVVGVDRLDRSIGSASYGHAGLMVRNSLYLPDEDYTSNGTKVKHVMYTTYAEANQERTAIGIWRDNEGGGYGNTGPIGTGTKINGVQGRFGRLITADASGAQMPNTSPDASRWLRIRRAGDIFNFYYSYDGVTWEADGSHTSVLNEKVLIGYIGMTDTNGKNPAYYSVSNIHGFGSYGLPEPAPILSIAKDGANAVISWTGTGFKLQSSATVDRGYENAADAVVVNGGVSTATVAATGSAKFYRLIK